MKTDPGRMGINRRGFLGSTLGGAAAAFMGGLPILGNPRRTSKTWLAPSVPANPNILIVGVDQMRPIGMHLNTTQSAAFRAMIPNILSIQANSYNFHAMYCPATVCTSSRCSTSVGLWSPQTGNFLGSPQMGGNPPPPMLSPNFYTWATAIQYVNTSYLGNCWWFGKWHQSNTTGLTAPLVPYGFKTRNFPGGPAGNNDPDGAPNEGTEGGPFNNAYFARDSDITNDFLDWLNSQPSGPWLSVVSFQNPHDIQGASQGALKRGFVPPPGSGVAFPAPPFGQTPIFTSSYLPPNWEDLTTAPKPPIQAAFAQEMKAGTAFNWGQYANWYAWLQNYVDAQIGVVINALKSSSFAQNTIIIFMSDHGEYAGSHGLCSKGVAGYEESIKVPVCVQFPGQVGSFPVNQLSSQVDLLGFICDLATQASGSWQSDFPDLSKRQRLWNFLVDPGARETRVTDDGEPYILHFFNDQTIVKDQPYCHLTVFRTKKGKLNVYYEWPIGQAYPAAGALPQYEFYDYVNAGNTAETGNDYYNPVSTVKANLAWHIAKLGAWGPPGTCTGVFANEALVPLAGMGTLGQTYATSAALTVEEYLTYSAAQ